MERSQEASQDSVQNSPRLIVHGEEEKSWFRKVKDKFLPGVKISLIIALLCYFALFVIGIWGIHRCPAEDMIPFFVIVTGAIGLVNKTLSILKETVLKTTDKIHLWESSTYTVELVFLILGSYWVFKEYKPNFINPNDKNYCNKTVYMSAFIYLAVLYALLGIIVISFFCFLGCIFFVKKTEDANNEDPESPTRPMQPQNGSP
ncbi:unnamed protein product [Ceutorhynchus assimilis]|uniref:Uncharacterized protein n=1 Tax=Ceutorhynchus assimilis TaxID=467358 RepID=A0A9N9QPT2_9CUCU|nr:unnamed protein product [Ceutorhynchus assimilis]